MKPIFRSITTRLYSFMQPNAVLYGLLLVLIGSLLLNIYQLNELNRLAADALLHQTLNKAEMLDMQAHLSAYQRTLHQKDLTIDALRQGRAAGPVGRPPTLPPAAAPR